MALACARAAFRPPAEEVSDESDGGSGDEAPERLIGHFDWPPGLATFTIELPTTLLDRDGKAISITMQDLFVRKKKCVHPERSSSEAYHFPCCFHEDFTERICALLFQMQAPALMRLLLGSCSPADHHAGAAATGATSAGQHAEQHTDATHLKRGEPSAPLEPWLCPGSERKASDIMKRELGAAHLSDGKELFVCVVVVTMEPVPSLPDFHGTCTAGSARQWAGICMKCACASRLVGRLVDRLGLAGL